MLDGDVGVTDASSGDLDYDFIGRRALKVHLREGERPAHFLNHRSRDLHPLPLFCVWSDAALAALAGGPAKCRGRVRGSLCSECGRATGATASPHRAVLYPTEEVFRPKTLGPPRLTLHSGMAGAKTAVAKLPAPVPRPHVLRPK